MARTAVAEKRPSRRVPPAKGKRTEPLRAKGKAGPSGREKSKDQEEDFDALAREALELDQMERETFAVSNVVYVSIVGRMSQATMKSKPGYIPGAELGDIVTSLKDNFGAETEVTVLGVYKLHGIYEPDKMEGGKKTQGKLKRYVMPEDAVQLRGLAQQAGYEVTNFDVALPDGTIMRPMHWVHIYLHKKPEITNAIISLRSTSNKVAGEIIKLIRSAEAKHSAELRFLLSHREESNENGEWFVPEFTLLDQRNFRVEDGSFQVVKGGFSKKEMYDVIKLSTDRRKDYNACVMVSKTDVKSLFGSEPKRALPPGGVNYEDDDDEDNVRF